MRENPHPVFALLLLTALISASCAGPAREPSAETDSVIPPDFIETVDLRHAGMFGPPDALAAPWGLDRGPDGTVYVCDRETPGIVRFGETGNIVARYQGAYARTDRLYAPVDIAASSGITVYAVDEADSRILRFDRNLRNAYTIFSRTHEQNRLFGSFSGIDYDQTTGDLYISDRDSGAIIRIDMLGGNVHTTGAFGSGRHALEEPRGLAVSTEGAVYIADRKAGTVAVMRHFGDTIATVGGQYLRAPVDVDIVPGRRLAVADENGIVLMTVEGKGLGYAGFGREPAIRPRSILCSGETLYVSDAITNRVLLFVIEDK